MTISLGRERNRTLGLLCAAVAAWALVPPSAVRAETLAITGGDVYTISDGTIRGGTVLIVDGKIAEVGTAVRVPEGAQVIDATGRTVMPGLVAARITGVTGGPGSSIAAAFDPYSTGVSFALASGITAGYVQVGGSGPVNGSTAVLKMAEGCIEGVVLREPAGYEVTYSTSSPAGKASLRRDLTEAAEYVRKKAQFDRDAAAGKKGEEPKPPRGAGPLLQLLSGEQPARVRASSASDILSALELSRDFGVHLILERVVEGWTVAQDIARYDADVIVTPRDMQTRDEWRNAPSGSSKEQSAILGRAGIHLAILPGSAGFSTGGDFGDDLFTLPLEAAWAVGGGLGEAAALEAITLGPARMLGVADRIGSLEVGKDGDVIILTGHPLHFRSLVDVTVVNGKVLYERSKSPYFAHIGAKPEPTEEPTPATEEPTSEPAPAPAQ